MYLEFMPLDVHFEIARYLPLKDALAYASVCTLAHDAVYYTFSHRKELNFTSLLDDNECIALPDAMILNILHAHIRAETLISFALPHTFTMFQDLEAYFFMYWRVLINQRNQQVGHPLGNLQYVDYRYYYGLHNSAPDENLTRMSTLRDTLEPYDEYLSCFNDGNNRGHGEFSFSEPYNNWCNTDLDTRYRPCPCCESTFPVSMFSSNGLCTHCDIMH